MKAAHSAVLALLVCLLVSALSALRAAEAAGRHAGDPSAMTSRRLAPIARTVRAIEQLQVGRLFWIHLLDELGRTKPDTAWFTGLHLVGMRDPDGVLATKAIKRRLGRLGTESAREAGADSPRIEACLRVPEDARAEVALWYAVEALRKTLVEDVRFVEEAEVIVMKPDRRDRLVRAVYLVDLKLSQPPNDNPPGGERPGPGEIEAAYAELKTLLLAWWDDSVYDPERTPRSPALFLGGLQKLRHDVRNSAQHKGVGLAAGVENLGFQELVHDVPPTQVTLQMLKEQSAIRDISILLINRNVESIESIEHLGPANGQGNLYRKLRFRVTFRAKWPALARFMLDLVHKTKVTVEPYGELPRNLLVIEQMSYLADEPAVRKEPAQPRVGIGGGRPTAHDGRPVVGRRPARNGPGIVGRAPGNNVLNVTMTIALIDFGEPITGPIPGADEESVEIEDAVAGADGPLPVGEVDPKALAHAIAVLAESINGSGLPEGFVVRDPTSDPHDVMPRKGEVACERMCGWIMPESRKRCPACGFVQQDDDDKDGMPNDWEDLHNVVDRFTADADEDADKDGFTNRQEYVGGSDPDDPKSIPSPFRLTNTYRKRLDILFRGYTIKQGGNPQVIDPKFWVVSLRFGRDPKAEFAALGGFWHGFKVGPLVKTQELVSPGGGIPDYIEDVYTLTLKRPGREPIKLIKGRWAAINETYVDLTVTRGKDTGKMLQGTPIGVVITVNGARYMVTQVGDAGVVIKSADGEAYTLR